MCGKEREREGGEFILKSEPTFRVPNQPNDNRITPHQANHLLNIPFLNTFVLGAEFLQREL